MAITGLFGSSPYELQQGRQAALSKAADAYGQTNPNDPYGFDRARSGLYMAGNQLGGGIAGLLGAEDPEMKKAADLQGILQQFDMTTPEGLMQAGKAAQAKGYGNEAMQAFAKAREMQAAALEAQVKKSNIFKNMDNTTNEMRNAAAVASSVAKPGTPEWDAAYAARLDELASKDATVQKVGVAERSREPVYRDKAGQFIYGKDAEGKQVRIPFNGGVDQTTSKTTVDARNIGESAFVKELGQLDAKQVNVAMDTRKAAIDKLNTLQKMVDIESRPLISGSLAEQRTDVSNFLNTLGLSSKADRMKTANSQEYIKYSTGLVLDDLKKTGYNPSNVDMKVVQATIARLETDPMARRELTQFMITAANKSIKEADNLETYARANKGLSGYRPVVPEVSFKGAAPASIYSGMSDAELDARIKAAQANKTN